MAGIRLAGPTAAYREPIRRFARHLGVAYQILNDLDDWQQPEPQEPAEPQKRAAGGDLLGGRPTVLWALALAGLPPHDRRQLELLLAQAAGGEEAVGRVRRLYAQAGVFRQAAALVSKHHARAREVADRLPSEPLRHLLYFLADAILDRRPLAL